MRKLIFFSAIIVLLSAVAAPAWAKDKKKKKVTANKVQMQTVDVKKPTLQNAGDSTAYIFGVSQANSLKAYMTQQLHVDTAFIEQFAQGILDRADVSADDKARVAYYHGLQIGTQIEQMTQSLAKDYYAAEPGRTIDMRIVAAAIVEGMLGRSTVGTDTAYQTFQRIMDARQKHNTEALYGPNREAGRHFLEENKAKPGVQVTASGLQYKVITQGDGPVPTAQQKVTVNYEGHLIDGTEFDSSYKRKQPTTFQVSQVIKGWTEALCMMPVGSKWELYIPYELAYGDRDTGKIKPYSALIFTVELLSIEDAAKQTVEEPAEEVTTNKKGKVRKAKTKNR